LAILQQTFGSGIVLPAAVCKEIHPGSPPETLFFIFASETKLYVLFAEVVK